ncbi:MAG: ExbD/TolR family protein [Nitrospinota bacterium]
MSHYSRKLYHSRRASRHNHRLISEINVTPFIDVMLVLLIIFIVTAPLLQNGLDVDLPEENLGPTLVADDLMVSLRKDGKIFFNDKRVTEEELLNEIKAISKNKAAQLFLRADKELSYDAVINLVGLIRKGGAVKIGLVATPEPL